MTDNKPYESKGLASMELAEFGALPEQEHQEMAAKSFEFLTQGIEPLIRSENQWFVYRRGSLERADRSVDRERRVIANYLERLRRQYSEYWNELIQLASQIPGMANTCRVTVNVPVFNEEKVILKFLRDYCRQSILTEDQWEINLLLNGPKGYQRDQTGRLVSEFIQNSNKHLRINCMDVEFPKEIANVGSARKLLQDLVFYRSLKRNNQRAPLYTQVEDADVFDVPENLLWSMVSKLDRNTHLDAVTGQHDRDLSVLNKNDLLLLERRLNIITETVFLRRNGKYMHRLLGYGSKMSKNQRWLRTTTTGWNTCFTAESLALVNGGFESNFKGNEDLTAGYRVSVLRGFPTREGVLLNTGSIGNIPLRVQSDNRRFTLFVIDSLRRGSFVYNPYNQFTKQSDHERIRQLRQDELLELPELKSVCDLTLLPKHRAKQLLNMLLDDYDNFLKQIFTVDTEQRMKEYAAFLSSYLIGKHGSVVYEGDRLRCVDILPLIQILKTRRQAINTSTGF